MQCARQLRRHPSRQTLTSLEFKTKFGGVASESNKFPLSSGCCAIQDFEIGRLVTLWKSEESADSVAYLYGPDPDHTGRLVLDKKTGAVTSDKTVPGVSAEDSWFLYGMLAKAKVEKLFKAQDYPDEASMAT